MPVTLTLSEHAALQHVANVAKELVAVSGKGAADWHAIPLSALQKLQGALAAYAALHAATPEPDTAAILGDQWDQYVRSPRGHGKSWLSYAALLHAQGAVPGQMVLGRLVKATVLNKIDLTTRDVVGYLQHWGLNWVTVGLQPDQTRQAVTTVVLYNPTTGEVHQLPLQTDYTETTLEVVRDE